MGMVTLRSFKWTKFPYWPHSQYQYQVAERGHRASIFANWIEHALEAIGPNSEARCSSKWFEMKHGDIEIQSNDFLPFSPILSRIGCGSDAITAIQFASFRFHDSRCHFFRFSSDPPNTFAAKFSFGLSTDIFILYLIIEFVLSKPAI